jgi:glycosyltransferase involved in cell wall biosynthesis
LDGDVVRILFVTSSYPASDADPRGIFIHRLARGLVRRGECVTVLAPGAPDAPGRECRDGVNVIRQRYWIRRWQLLTRGLAGIVPNLQHRPWLAAQVLPLVAAMAWRATIEARRHDVVHAHWIYPAGIAAMIAARLTGRPLVITSHGGDLNLAAKVAPLRGVCRVVCRAASACVGVSEASTHAFMSVGVGKDRQEFIPLGADFECAPDVAATGLSGSLSRFRTAEGFRILYLGSITARKSVHTLVSAHERLERAGHRVVTAIVGSGPCDGQLEAAVSEGGARNIILAGSQAPALAATWLASADVLVLPSLSEGRPTVIIDAMASGVPVIATDIVGTRELVSNGRTGLLFPPGDAEALTQRLVELLTDPVLRARMGEEARGMVEAHHLTTEATARRYSALYARVCIAAPGDDVAGELIR